MLADVKYVHVADNNSEGRTELKGPQEAQLAVLGDAARGLLRTQAAHASSPARPSKRSRKASRELVQLKVQTRAYESQQPLRAPRRATASSSAAAAMEVDEESGASGDKENTDNAAQRKPTPARQHKRGRSSSNSRSASGGDSGRTSAVKKRKRPARRRATAERPARTRAATAAATAAAVAEEEEDGSDEEEQAQDEQAPAATAARGQAPATTAARGPKRQCVCQHGGRLAVPTSAMQTGEASLAALQLPLLPLPKEAPNNTAGFIAGLAAVNAQLLMGLGRLYVEAIQQQHGAARSK